LIFDEPTSALDGLHEQTVMASLQKMRKHRTIILVTHRVPTVETCDCIYVMENGRIVESGTHSELLARGGHYFNLLNASQSGA
jgi:ABC-type multidrug transport system fused ATPase/permease subunit